MLCVRQHVYCCLILCYRNINCLSDTFFWSLPPPPLLCQVSDRGGERCCGSPTVLRRVALIWWSPSPVRIPPATCGRSNKKKDALPLKAPVVLELQSRMSPASALKVLSSVCVKIIILSHKTKSDFYGSSISPSSSY